MSGNAIDTLPRREREIFELVCSAGEATAAAVRAAMRDPPSHSAVRTLLARLEAKGLLRHRLADQTYVYRSVPQPAKIRESALRQLVKTFFDGSAANAATALLGLSKSLKPEEIEALQRAIDEMKERGQ
jgi:predicted transcriptional regulator